MKTRAGARVDLLERFQRCRPNLETLEQRSLLAAGGLTALGIEGVVFGDANANSTADPGEGVPGAMVRLFLDDGDGVFEPGSGDTQVGADAITNAQGNYCFDNLDQGVGYFVQQPAQSVGGIDLESQTSNLISITPTLIIDRFATTQTTAALPPPISSDESSLGFPDESEVIGRERDLSVQLSSGTSEVQLRVNPFGLDSVLLFDSSAGSQGTREITWDGIDNDGDGLAFGLNNRDLTQNGELSGLGFKMGVDANGASARVRLYDNNAATLSEASVAIPETGGTADEWAYIPFSAFNGPVNPNSVDAIQLILDTGTTSVDGQIDVIGATGSREANFANAVGIDLELTKTSDVTEVDRGSQVSYTLTVTNNDANATASATGVQIRDALPTGLTFVSSNPSDGTFANDVWSLASPLAPGDSETLTIVASVNANVNGGATINNVAEVIAHDQADIDSQPNNDDGDQSQDDEDNTPITVRNLIDLELMKVANATTVDAGDEVTFTITLTNNTANANTDATGVQVTDQLPGSMSLVSGTPSGNGVFNNGVWTLVDPLAPGDTETLVLIATVNSTAPGNSDLTNVAQVTAANEVDIDSQPNNDDGDQSQDDEDSAVFNVNGVIDLEVEKTVNVSQVDIGDTVVWTVSVTNNQQNANTAATGVLISDVLPAGVTLQNATPSGNGTFNSGVWALVDPLQPGAAATLTLTTTVASGAGGGNLTNVAQVTAADQTDIDSQPNNDDGDQSQDDEANASISLNARIDLELQKAVNQTTVTNGQEVTWTVTLTNNAANANADATGVTVTDILPAGVTFVSASPSVGTFNNNVWTLGTSLSPGAVATLSIVSSVDSGVVGGTVITNVAQVSAANEVDVDSAPNNDDGDQSQDDEDNAAITVTGQIDLELDKSVDQSNVNIGDTVNWTILVTNNQQNANSNATGVTIRDTLPTGLTFVSSNATNGSYNNGTGLWTLTAPLAPGASATLTIVSTVQDAAAGSSLLNIAQVASHNESDFDSQPDNDDGDQSQDDEDAELLTIGIVRPPSKRSLLSSNLRS